MSITPLPSAPAITDTTAEFNTKAFNWVAALDTFTTEANALGAAAEDAADAAAADAVAAEASATAATAATNAEAWVSGTTYAIGDAVYSPINLQSYRRKTAGAGTTDPSLDATNWTQISQALVAASQAEMETGTEAALRSMSPLRVAQAVDIRTSSIQTTLQNNIDAEKQPIGIAQLFYGATTTTYPGAKWLKCDGSIVTTSTYSDLQAKIGTVPNNFTWNAQTSGTTVTINSVIYANGKYVYGVVGASTRGAQVVTSTDLANWSVATLTTTTNVAVNCVAYGGGMYVASTSNGVIAYSSNGTGWTTLTYFVGTSPIYGLYYAVDKFYFVSSNALYSTTDITNTATYSYLMNYSPVTSEKPMAYGNGVYVVSGYDSSISAYGVYTSTNGSSWTFSSTGIYGLSLIYGGGLFVLAGQSGALYTSTNGTTWTTRTSGTTSQINSLAYGNETFYYCGATGAFGYSHKGETWTAIAGVTTTSMLSLTYDGDSSYKYGFIASGRTGLLLSSYPFTYNITTSFKLPTQSATTAIDSPKSTLYVKATA